MDLPDCAWDCGTALTPSALVHGTEGQDHYICSCCSKTTRVDRDGIAHRVERRSPDVRDALGVVMYDP